jgi:hypothetical protein
LSWMNDIDRDFVYTCPHCRESFRVTMKQNDPSYRDPRPCACGHMAEYEYFLPIKMALRGRVAFDQNGRKGYAISDGKGGVRYVSATKLHYQETGDIKPHYTRAYEEHLRKEQKEDLLETSSYKDIVDSRNKRKKPRRSN